MHTLSKVCLVLALLLGMGGAYLTTQVAKKRNAIAETIVAEKKKRDDNIKQIASLKITRGKEVDELDRLMSEWGRQWTTKGQTDKMIGAILLNIGAPQGFGIQPPNRGDQPVYIFHLDPAGTSRFLGEFIVSPGAQQQSVVRLNRRPYPQELESWPVDGEFRVRERIPPGVRAIFHDLVTNQSIADQIVINETAKLQIQDNHIAASQKTLDRRLAELNGDPAAPQTADREIVSGLVDTIRVEEAERNAVLKDVDALRRSLSDHYARLERVLAENRQAIEAMSAGTETAASTRPQAN
ncbi:hypothetical protein Pan44_05890 [Caulifigura coniformis]|uniref:Uncharacterized protein n=1 Tax=Caulifigura coniformis TaxID=2527983 RepID=A0A517S8W3_9PLAN|nr:hypothetical protein [Caulifigura coniformis]QDT52577.1 hypothetical protein Pan44_05890 [Caulifigura coniformis]